MTLEATLRSGIFSRDQEVDLVKRHCYGDDEAFEEIYSRYGPMIHNLTLRMAGDPGTAADLTQEIFLRIHRHLGKFKGRSSLKTWIYKIGVNCCRSKLKRRSIFRKRFPDTDITNLVEVEDPAYGPERQAIAKGVVNEVTIALSKLPVVFREAVGLRDIQGLSYAEIAEVTRVQIGTVRSRIARGRLRLKSIFEESV